MRFEKEPGGAPIADTGDGFAVLVGDDTPDDVTLPAELGGGIVKVIKVYWRSCPVHTDHNTKCLELENGIHVAECDRFYWFRPG